MLLQIIYNITLSYSFDIFVFQIDGMLIIGNISVFYMIDSENHGVVRAKDKLK